MIGAAYALVPSLTATFCGTILAFRWVTAVDWSGALLISAATTGASFVLYLGSVYHAIRYLKHHLVDRDAPFAWHIRFQLLAGITLVLPALLAVLLYDVELMRATLTSVVSLLFSALIGFVFARVMGLLLHRTFDRKVQPRS